MAASSEPHDKAADPANGMPMVNDSTSAPAPTAVANHAARSIVQIPRQSDDPIHHRKRCERQACQRNSRPHRKAANPEVPQRTRHPLRNEGRPKGRDKARCEMPRGRSVQRSMRSRRSLEKRVVRNAMASPMNAPDAMGASVVNSTIGNCKKARFMVAPPHGPHLRAKGPIVVFDGPPSYGAAPSSAPCARIVRQPVSPPQPPRHVRSPR